MEYAEADSFKRDRLKMLKTLLMIPNIYSSAKLQEKLEEAARRNIRKEIEALQA
jgi:predicted metal-dependent HD superfamily phosphohydrolase